MAEPKVLVFFYGSFINRPVLARIPGRDHEELRSRVAHILGVQQGFLSVLRGEPPGMPPDGPPPSFEEPKARAVIGHAGLRDFAAALRPGTLSETVRIPWFPDPPCVITVAEALVQVAMHTAASPRTGHDAAEGLRGRAEDRGLDHLAVEAEAPGPVGLS